MSNNVVVTGNLTVIGTPNFSPTLYFKQAILKDVKTSGTNGGDAVAGNQIRTLNTVIDPGNIVTLNANDKDFKINELGTYHIKVQTPAYSIPYHRNFLADTSNVSIAVGSCEYTQFPTTNSYLMTIMEVTDVADEYRVIHYTCSVQATNGLRVQNGVEEEIYTQVQIMKLTV